MSWLTTLHGLGGDRAAVGEGQQQNVGMFDEKKRKVLPFAITATYFASFGGSGLGIRRGRLWAGNLFCESRNPNSEPLLYSSSYLRKTVLSVGQVQ